MAGPPIIADSFFYSFVMVSKKSAIISIILVVTTLPPAHGFAMTVREWDNEVQSNAPQATKDLQASYKKIVVEAAAHYRGKGDEDRARYVETLQPDTKVLINRIELAISKDDKTDLDDVVRGYIIDASSPKNRNRQ